VGILELTGDPSLGLETACGIGLRGQRPVQDFNRYVFAQVDVPSAKHGAECPFSQQLLELVLAAEYAPDQFLMRPLHLA
jgi:hypothetical protein